MPDPPLPGPRAKERKLDDPQGPESDSRRRGGDAGRGVRSAAEDRVRAPRRDVELAQLAVHMERNPTMASEMLAQHGMTQEQLSEAMTRVAADTTMSAMFMQAKEAAMAAAASEPAMPAPAATEAGH